MSTKRNRNLPQQLTLDHVSPATRLLEKRRQMFEVQEALDAQKEEFQRREATFKRREEMLKKKDLELQESLIRFNKFLQENDSKRNRAEKKRLDEAKLKTSKEVEIQRLLEVVEEQRKERKEMEVEVNKMLSYQRFLETVLEVEEDYAEINDLLSRHETLHAAHTDLVSRQDTAAIENEMARSELQSYMKQKSDEILNCNNQIAELQQRSEQAQAAVLDLKLQNERQTTTVADSTKQLGQVLMACENIYSRCLLKSKGTVKPQSADDTEETTEMYLEKLSVIQNKMTDLIAISRLAKPKDATAPKAEGASAAPSPGGGTAKNSSQPDAQQGGKPSVRGSHGTGSHGASVSRHSVSSSEAGSAR